MRAAHLVGVGDGVHRREEVERPHEDDNQREDEAAALRQLVVPGVGASLEVAAPVEVGADGILVNAIAPGYIATELNTALLEDQEFSEWVISKTPLARWGQPHELGGGAVFLMSEAGSFVNGQVLSIDGGMSIQV